jgi:hypothetical protein
MPLKPSEKPLELALRAHALVQAHPARALALAERALVVARAERAREAEVAALHALGFARYTLGDSRALRTVRAAVRLAERYGFPERAALARRNLAVYLAYAGRTAAALHELGRARAALTGLERARTAVFAIAVFGIVGRSREGLTGSDTALRTLRRAGDTTWEARLLRNRGASLAELGDLRAARRDLERARALYEGLALDEAAASTRIQLARLRFFEGAFVDGLVELDAIQVGRLTDWTACFFHLSRAEGLVALRLLDEARSDLSRFTELSAGAAALDTLNHGRLEAARLALLAGDPESASALAARARRSFAGRRQTAFAAAATLLELDAATRGGRAAAGTVGRARRAAHELAGAGFEVAALRARLVSARAAALAASPGLAARELGAARALDRRGTVEDRIGLRHAEALVHLLNGNQDAAARSLLRGLRLLDDYRAAFGALELRTSASAVGAALSSTGLRIAVDSADAKAVLLWSERLRANALRLPAVRAPADRRLRAFQTELRQLSARVRAVESEGPAPRTLAARQSELEGAIRARTRHIRGERSPATSVPGPADAARTLDNRALVEYLELDGRMWALTLAQGKPALHELDGPEVAGELEWLRFSLGRVAARTSTPAGRAAALASAAGAAARLDQALVEPLLSSVGDAPLVLVPTGALHALPWAALPSFRGRPIVVAPSLSTWIDVAQRPRSRRRRRVLIAGPRLRHAAAEVHALGAELAGDVVLHGKAATAEATLRALDGAALAHIACHGRFRADSPLFSALELADGPLTALELQRLKRAPDTIVLSSCDLALSDRQPGDELLGLSAALLAQGTRTIIASVVPIPDAAARRLMLAFHRFLAEGAPPATALARAQETLRGGSAALAGFVCLGSG